jgi:hypothetical protein
MTRGPLSRMQFRNREGLGEGWRGQLKKSSYPADLVETPLGFAEQDPRVYFLDRCTRDTSPVLLFIRGAFLRSC